MLAIQPISQLIKLREQHGDDDCGYFLCSLMEIFDVYSEDIGTSDDNKWSALWSRIILTIGLAGVSANGFLGGHTLGIVDYISWILSFFAYVLNFWGWWRYIESTIVYNRYTTFSSWRVNMLNAIVVCVFALWNFGATLIWWSNFPNSVSTAFGSLFVSVIGAYMIWVNVQNLWWNYDEDGSMADEAGWDWFASEDDVEEYEEEIYDDDYYYY